MGKSKSTKGKIMVASYADLLEKYGIDPAVTGIDMNRSLKTFHKPPINNGPDPGDTSFIDMMLLQTMQRSELVGTTAGPGQASGSEKQNAFRRYLKVSEHRDVIESLAKKYQIDPVILMEAIADYYELTNMWVKSTL